MQRITKLPEKGNGKTEWRGQSRSIDALQDYWRKAFHQLVTPEAPAQEQPLGQPISLCFVVPRRRGTREVTLIPLLKSGQASPKDVLAAIKAASVVMEAAQW
jgi:hypothetical protein